MPRRPEKKNLYENASYADSHLTGLRCACADDEGGGRKVKAVSQFDNLQKAFNTQKVKDENKDLITSFEPELDELFALDEDRVSRHVIMLLHVMY